MKHNHGNEIWDRFRDGEATPEEQAVLRQVMREEPELCELWDAESQWLDVLGEQDAPANDPDFTRDILDRWESEVEQPVIGRIHWRHIWSASAAATVAALLLLMIWIGRTNQVNTNPAPEIAKGDADTKTVAVNDPAGALVNDMSERVSQQPARIRAAFNRTASLFEIDQVMSVFQVQVPDPAQLVEPNEEAG